MKHADELEDLMGTGISFTEARRRLYIELRPNCVICGRSILGGNEGSKFCPHTQECKTAARRYRLYRDKGMTPEDAEAKAIAMNKSGGTNYGDNYAAA